MDKVDFDAGVLVDVYRSRTNHGWIGSAPEYIKGLGVKQREGYFVVRGVGLVNASERIDFGAAVERTVRVTLISGGFRGWAKVCGSLQSTPDSLIELAARAALRECKRRNRRKAKNAADDSVARRRR